MRHWVYPLSFIINVIFFFGTHYWKNKGFVVVKRETLGTAALRWRVQQHDFLQWLPTPSNLLRYSQHKVARYGTNATAFALFLSLNYMAPFFMHIHGNAAMHIWILGIKSISVFLCIGLLLRPYWPKALLPYFAFYYHLTLFYCLSFVTTFLFLLEGNSIEWVVNVSLSIMLLIVLVDWGTFVWMSILGTLLATV